MRLVVLFILVIISAPLYSLQLSLDLNSIVAELHNKQEASALIDEELDYEVKIADGSKLTFKRSWLAQASYFEKLLDDGGIFLTGGPIQTLRQFLEFRDILKIIAEDIYTPTESVEKFLNTKLFSDFEDIDSLDSDYEDFPREAVMKIYQDICHLYDLGMYYDIKVLREVTQSMLAHCFEAHQKTLIPLLATYPLDKQKSLTFDLVSENEILVRFLKVHAYTTESPPQDMNSFQTLHWSPDSTKLAFVGKRNVNILDAATVLPRILIPGRASDTAGNIAWSPDGKWLATASLCGIIIDIWDVTQGTCMAKLPCKEPPRGLIRLSWSPDSTTLAYHHDNILYMWDVVQKKELWAAILEQTITSFWIEWSPDSKKIAFSCGKEVSIMEALQFPKVICRKFFTESAHVRLIRWSPDGSKLAIAHYDGTSIRSAEGSIDQLKKIGYMGTSFVWVSKNELRGCGWYEMVSVEKFEQLAYMGTLHNIIHGTWSPDGKKYVWICEREENQVEKPTIKVCDVDLHVLKLTLEQIKLLEKIISAQKVVPSEGHRDYEGLPKIWKAMLKRAYPPTFFEKVLKIVQKPQALLLAGTAALAAWHLMKYKKTA